MKQTLVLVQNQSDAANLTNAGKWLISHGVTSAWVLLSPQVLVTAESASAKIDAEIAELRVLEDAASKARKHGEAEGFSKQIDMKLMDKAQEVAVAYRNLTPEESQKRLKEMLSGIFEIAQGAGMNFKAQCAKEHYETDNFVNFLNASLAGRPPGFEPGNFGIEWAASLTDTEKTESPALTGPMTPIAEVAASKPVVEAKTKFDPSIFRSLEALESLPHFSLASVAKHHGISIPKGQPKEETIKQIWTKQNVATAA